MVTNPCISLATNPENIRIMLQSTTKSDYHLTIDQRSFGLQSVSIFLPIDLSSVDLFELMLMS
jgi:hypothetical protein